MFTTYSLTEFGSILKNIRISCGLTQSEVSKSAGVHEDSLRKIENGLVIPKYETLQYLSDIYKIDLLELLIEHKSNKDLLAFVDRVNEVIVNNNVQELNSVVDDFNDILVIADEKFNIINNNEINMFRLYLNSIEEYFKNNENSYLLAKKYLLEALSSIYENFNYLEISNYRFNYFELSLLLLLGIVLFNLKELEASTRIMEFSLISMEGKSSRSPLRTQMILKLMYNLSHNYHDEGKHLDALNMASKAIEFAISKDTLFSLPHLFYRKGIAQYKLGLDDYLDSINKSIILLDICNKQDLKEKFISITEDLYNIKINF